MAIEIGSIYKHYKGDLYVVSDIGYMEDTKEEMVIYTLHCGTITWIRPVKEFEEKFKPFNP